MSAAAESSETILLVDDEEPVRKTFREWLSGLPCKILTAADAEAALVLANQHAIDLAILDWNLGAGFSLRHSMPFDPYQDASGAKLRYTPGDEMRARLGVDHPYGAGRASIVVAVAA